MAKSGAIEKAESKPSALVEHVKDQGKILAGTVGLMWVIQIVNAATSGGLVRFGIEPRHLSGLPGILFAPFIHGSWAHLIANTVPFLVLGWITMLRRKRDFFYVAGISGLVGGLGTWLFGSLFAGGNVVPYHIGASGIIFGFLGYLLSRGVFERKLWSILAGLAALFLYGGALVGILPGTPGISWEGHLFGLLGGILAARVLAASPAKEQGEKAPTPQRARVAASPDDKPRLKASKQPVDALDDDVEAELEALRKRA